MWKIKGRLGFLALSILLLVVAADIGSHVGWTPVLFSADNKFAVFAFRGTLSIEWAGDQRIDNLAAKGHPLWRLDIDSNNRPYVEFSRNGRHVSLGLIELLLLLASVFLLMAPMWAQRIRRLEGLCPACEYCVVGISSEHCPECGAIIPSDMVRIHEMVDSRRLSFRVRSSVLPYLFALAFWLIFRAVLGAATPTRFENLSALDARPGVFMIEAGDRERLRTNGGIIEFTLGNTSSSACKWDAAWTPTGATPVKSSGVLSESPPVVTRFTVGPTTLKWSVGDATHHWISLTDDGTNRIEVPQGH